MATLISIKELLNVTFNIGYIDDKSTKTICLLFWGDINDAVTGKTCHTSVVKVQRFWLSFVWSVIVMFLQSLFKQKVS